MPLAVFLCGAAFFKSYEAKQGQENKSADGTT